MSDAITYLHVADSNKRGFFLVFLFFVFLKGLSGFSTVIEIFFFSTICFRSLSLQVLETNCIEICYRCLDYPRPRAFNFKRIGKIRKKHHLELKKNIKTAIFSLCNAHSVLTNSWLFWWFLSQLLASAMQLSPLPLCPPFPPPGRQTACSRIHFTNLSTFLGPTPGSVLLRSGTFAADVTQMIWQ